MGKEVWYTYHGYDFTWDSEKGHINPEKHGVSFEEACQAVLNEVQVMEDSGEEGEQRWSVIAFSRSSRRYHPLYVVVAEKGDEAWRTISAREATPSERLRYEEEVGTY